MNAQRWRGPGGYGEVVFTLAEHASPAERATALSRRLACELFEAWCPGHHMRGGALATLAELGIALDARLTDDTAALRRRVGDALRDGRVLALPRGGREVRTSAAPAEEREVARAPEPTTLETAKTWITIRLVYEDAQTVPVAGAKYRIRLPDGSILEGQLDDQGVAHHRDIDPGVCEVSFPEFDAREWRRL